MSARPFSIRRRILAFATTLFVLAALGVVLFIRSSAERSADEAFDRLLAASALMIASAIQLDRGAVTIELPSSAFAMFSGSDRIFYAVKAPDGRLVTGDDGLADGLTSASASVPVFVDGIFRGVAVRVVSVGRLASVGEGANWVTIHVAETMGERDLLSASIVHNAILPVLVMSLVALALLWFGIGRAFTPLAQLERHLRTRAPNDVLRVDVPTPVETAQLVEALNDFTARLAAARERLRALVAEAAHEIRTPLASLRAQAEVAKDEEDVAAQRAQIGRIHAAAVHASQLASQLLMDATVTHRLDTAELSRTQVRPVVAEVLTRLDRDHVGRLTLDIEPDAEWFEIGIDHVVLREALRNLIDNALRYSDAEVVLGVRAKSGSVQIRVLDRGPGIPEAEKAEVLKRFKRGSTGMARDPHGSGLGLAIVAGVVEARHGSIALRDRAGGGLEVVLSLPVAPPPARASRPGAGLAACVVALLISLPPLPGAQAGERLFSAPAGPASAESLHIAGSTDTSAFAFLVEAFQAARPGVAVRYEEIETLPLYERLRQPGEDVPDVVMSSAADLQFKLANDGLVRHAELAHAGLVPAWAKWRSEVFGFTFEPAVIVYNRNLVSEAEAPRSHLQLVELLQREAKRLSGRVATYDVGESGIGYLFAVQDEAVSTYFWRLAAASGHVDVRLSRSSPEMLDDLAEGRLAIGYNILGSYAFARQAAGAPIGIVVPDDYVSVVTRSMVIPVKAPRPDLAEAFVDFALSPDGQTVLAGPAMLGSIVPATPGAFTSERITSLGRGAVQPVPFTASLLVGLDPLRRARFLRTWRQLVAPEIAPADNSPP